MNTLSELLTHLSEQKKELDSLRPLTSEQVGRIDQHFRLLLNYHSNSLEGNSLDFGETKMVVLHGMTADGKPLRDHFEIIGHNTALKWIGELISGEEPLTERFIRELHLTILEKRFRKEVRTPDGQIGYTWVEVGQYKNKPNHVETSTGEMFYFASVEDTPVKMQELVTWYNKEVVAGDLHPLLLAAELHYRFVRIHPFDDGNGRVARLLLSFVLLCFGYSHLVVKTDAKAAYLTALEAYDDGREEEFYRFLAESLTESMDLMLKGAKDEPMEEEEDWKKRLKVIQRSMAEDDTPIEPMTDEHLHKRFNDTFHPIHEELIEALKIFDELYAHTNHENYAFREKSFPFQHGWRNDENLISHYGDRDKVAENMLRSALKFQLRWEALKNSGAELYGNAISVSFDCTDKYVYQVRSSVTENPYLKKRYTEAMTAQERKDFVNTVAEKLVQLLDNQFNEVQRLKNEEL